MHPRHHVSAAFILTFNIVLLASHSHAYRDEFAMDDDFLSDFIDNLSVSPARDHVVADDLRQRLLEEMEEIPRIEDVVGQQAEDFLQTSFRKFTFPKLSIEHRKFAVHPGYESYYNPELRHLEDEHDKKRGERQRPPIIPEEEKNSEVVEDPFSGDNKDADNEMNEKVASPKKASAGALSGEDTRQADGGVKSNSMNDKDRFNDFYFTTIVAVSSALAAFVIIGAGICYHRMQKNAKAAEDVEYPAYGVTGPGKETSPTSGADRKLAQNAQMYHYQHQKQQMIAFDSHQTASGPRGARAPGGLSDDESDDGEEGDYTVYECPGLAPTGEMEVRNPMFSDDNTPKATK